MDRLEKGWRQVLSVTMLLIFTILMGYGSSSLQKVSAAGPETGAFHLKAYVGIDGQENATGLKVDEQDMTGPLYGKAVIAGIEYEIYRTHNYINEKLVEITGGPVEILDNGNRYKTDANGEINISSLPLGQYEFKQVSVPEGIRADTQEYYFVLPFSIEEGGELQYEVYVYPKYAKLTGSLSFQKIGDDGTEGLKNVVFEIYQEDGTPVQDGDGNKQSVTTRLSGQAVIQDLPTGKYYLLETKNPDGDYLESSHTKYWFEIYSENNEVKSKAFYTNQSMEKRIVDADGKELSEGVIINYKVPDVVKTASAKSAQDIKNGLVYIDSEGNLYANVDIPYVYTITTTLPKDLMTYVKFEIYDAFSTGNIVLITDLPDIVPVAKGGNSQPELKAGEDFTVEREGTAGYRLKFKEHGIAVLAAAKCTGIEVTFDAKIPKGYQVQETVKKGEINEAVADFDTDHSDPFVSATKNTVYPRAGEIIVRKVDKANTSKLLAGARFSLKDAAGKEYWGTEHVTYLNVNGKTTKNVKKAATFIFTQLPYGTYTLKETRAPSGYAISSETKTINLRATKDPTATWISHKETVKNTATEGKTPDTEKKPDSGTTPGSGAGFGSGSLAKTGDQTRLLLYIVGLMVSGMVVAFFYGQRKKRLEKHRGRTKLAKRRADHYKRGYEDNGII